LEEEPIPAASKVSRIDTSIVIAAPADRILRAFFDRSALCTWWQVAASITAPRVLGPYVLEWRTTEFKDEILGRLGGVLRGTVIQIDSDGFVLADLYWLPPDGDPIGPMALEMTCSKAASEAAPSDEQATHVRVLQTGFEDSPRWRRYYALFSVGWERALATLKELLER
jgi:uncharacterized protein YndB with AHSA1/START domain